VQRGIGRWKYHRDSKNAVSKWMLGGRSWVTKRDKDDAVVVGVNGERIGDFYGAVHEAKRFVECMTPESPNCWLKMSDPAHENAINNTESPHPGSMQRMVRPL